MEKTTLKNKNKTKGLLVIISLAVIFGCLPGCGLFNKNSGQQSSQGEQTDKIPKQLEGLESTIEEIFIALDGPSIGTQKEQSNQDQGKNDSSSSEKDQSTSQDKEQQKPEQGQEQQGQEQGQKQSTQQTSEEDRKAKDPWQQVTQGINDLHGNWNEYMPEVTKKGGTKEILDGFSNSLNNLTKIAEDKDKEKTLLAANQVYSQVANIYSLYKSKTPPELKRISFYTRNAVLTSQTADWSKAASDLGEVKTRWSLAKNSVGKEQQEDSAKLDLSIYELEKVIKEKNKDLIEIKGKITLQNIQDLQKAMEKG